MSLEMPLLRMHVDLPWSALRPLRGVLLVVSVVALGCDTQDGDQEDDAGDEVPECVTVDPAECAMAYQPTWTNVYEQTLEKRCAIGEGSCHGNPDSTGARNGLVLSDPDEAYSILTGEGVGHAFVKPGDPGCSALVVRLDIDDPIRRMPPAGEPLDDRERCSIRRWITDGALR